MAPRNLSDEELLARAKAKGYNHGAHREEDTIRDIKTYKDKTLRDQDGALRLYKRWREIDEKEHDGTELYADNVSKVAPRLEEGSCPPDIGILMDFVRFHAALGDGRIDDGGLITADSSNTFMEWFFAGFARITGVQINEEDRKKVYQLTRTVLVEEGVVANKRKKKHLFGKTELIQFNTTFWTVDDDIFVHPRNKAQIPFIISVFCWTGARIGAFFPDSSNKDNGGLRYRDIEIVLKRKPSGGWKAMYRLDQRWVKNNRDPENTTYGASTGQHSVPLFDDTQFLLVMALADKALFGIESIQQLNDQQIPEGDDELLLRWNDSALRSPILRNATMQNGVSEEPLPKKTFDRIFKAVLERSGYFGKATVHAIRRYLGKKVNERYTEVERSQHITQTDTRVYGRDYVANTSSVDGRSAFLNEPAQHDHVEYFQSFAKFREKGLPISLPAEREAAIWQDSKLVALKDQVSKLKNDDATPSEIKMAKNKMQSYQTSLLKKALEQYQNEWVRERRDWKILTRGKERAENDIKTDLLQTLSLVFPERGRLARRMISEKIISDSERRQCMEDLYAMITRDYSVLYRPKEEPVNGVCPVKNCNLIMTSLPKRQRNPHIHKCLQDELASTLHRQPPELKYCFLCFCWFVEEKWEEHCKSHLKSLSSKRCGPITCCGTLIRPGFCPFCLGNEELDAASRLGSWTRETKLRNHIRSHLSKACWPQKCPFPSCALRLDTEPSSLYHLSDVHGIGMGQSMRDSKPDDTINHFIDWNLDLTSRKRKREESDSTKVDLSIEESYMADSKTPSLIQTVSPSSLSITSPSNTSLPDVQELLHSNQMLLPDATQPDPDDALFSNFLRSRSSSCFLEPKDNNNKTFHLQSPPMKDTCTPTELNPGPAKSVERDVIEISDSPSQPKKPRVTLRLHQLADEAKPKILLRVKKPEAKPSIKQSKKSIFKKNAKGYSESKRSQKRFRQSFQPISHEEPAVELQNNVSRRTRIGREIRLTKKAADARKR